MSSTYGHYQGPSSLPSDYAVLNRYNPGSENAILESSGEHGAPRSSARPRNGRRAARRDSFSSETHHRPRNPTMGTYPRPEMVESTRQMKQVSALPTTECTPLLASNAHSLPPPPPPPRSGAYDSNECQDRASHATSEAAMKMFWEELPILTRYALPMFGTHLLEYSLVVVSVVSIGHLSTTALAAISLGSMTASVSGFSVIQGFASALDTMLPSAWTSPQPQLVGLWAQRMTVVMFASLIPTFMIWWNAEIILLFLRQEPEVAHLAAIYLRWVSMGLPAYAFNCISRRYFQSQVWGPDPIRLGFIGAPIATAISFNLISIASIVYGIFYAPHTAWHPLSRRMFTSLGVLVQLGLSGVGQTASEWWAWELISLAASQFGPTVLATQSVILVSSTTTFQAPFALSLATSVRIGNLLGEGNAKRAEVAANTAIIMSLMISCFTSGLFIVFRNKWAYMFNDDPDVVKLVASIMPLLGLFQVFDAIAGVTGGILRARGKQFLGALLNLSAYYIFGIPLALYLAFSYDMGLLGLWLGLTFSLVYCAALNTWLCLRTDWDREVYKVALRLKEENAKMVEHERGMLHV
ncbi:mate-domain-containing protein [Crassisporium funariophilum]|nr:mate-domain-containing protein [Crassisporium funariophilum]